MCARPICWKRVPRLAVVALVLSAGVWQPEPADAGEHLVPLFLSATDGERESFVRVINRSELDGEIEIVATDDSGWQPDALRLAIRARETVHFNSGDFESGNADKGLEGSAGVPVEGDWRLKLQTRLDVEVLGYIRTRDGLLSSMLDTVPPHGSGHPVSTFNPGSNVNQVSRLRLVNTGAEDAAVMIRGIDDLGLSPGDDAVLTIPGGAAKTLTAQQLESGSAPALEGGIGDGTGKWQLRVTADQPLRVMSLLDSPTGHLTNLSTPGPDGGPVHIVGMFPPASDAERQGFVRVINHGGTPATVSVTAFDDSGRDYGPIELAMGARETRHFNSDDLELGNVGKGLPEGVGPGEGTWRLRLESPPDVEVLSYIRTPDGFLTSMHDRVPSAGTRHRVSTFNPGRNTDQVSLLRITNPADEPVQVTIRGLDGNGESPGDEVHLSLEARASRTLTAQELESGAADGLTGALGQGAGKWQLIVAADRKVRLMSLLASPTGHLTNLSSRPPRAHVGPINDLFEEWNTKLEPKPWWRDSTPYSCAPTDNAESPWVSAGLPDPGGSDPLSLIRFFGNGSYLRYGNMGFGGCTSMWKHPGNTHLDAPIDPTYYSTGELDLTVDIARVPPGAEAWPSDERVEVSLDDTVRLLNEYVGPFYGKLSEGQLRMGFEPGEDFVVRGEGSHRDLDAHYREIVGVDCEEWPCSADLPGAINRILFVDVRGLGGGASFGAARLPLETVETAYMASIVHEVGHGWFRWPHSYAEVMWRPYPNDEITTPNQYNNRFDFMSGLEEKNGWRHTMPATLAINRYSAGWIPPENVALHLTAPATYTLRKPYDGGHQFLVVNSGRPYAFTTLEIPDDRDPEYLEEHFAYDPTAPDNRRPHRYDGVLVSRYDQTTGTGGYARLGPAFHDRRNPNFLEDVGWGRDDHSLLVDGETRDIGGVAVTVARNGDGTYDVTLRGGRVAEFEAWCRAFWFMGDAFDTGCTFDDPR